MEKKRQMDLIAELHRELDKIIGSEEKVEYKEGRLVETITREELYSMCEDTMLSLSGYGLEEKYLVEATVNLIKEHLWMFK